MHYILVLFQIISSGLQAPSAGLSVIDVLMKLRGNIVHDDDDSLCEDSREAWLIKLVSLLTMPLAVAPFTNMV